MVHPQERTPALKPSFDPTASPITQVPQEHRIKAMLPQCREVGIEHPSHCTPALYHSRLRQHPRHKSHDCNKTNLTHQISLQYTHIQVMSNNSKSSAESSPCASPSSSRSGSYTNRPTPRREHSYTHVFPANPSAVSPTKPRKTTLKPRIDTKQRGSYAWPTAQLETSDRTRQFYSGLDWLLEATSSSWGPMPGQSDFCTPLTEGALRQLNAQRKDSCFATEANGDENESKD